MKRKCLPPNPLIECLRTTLQPRNCPLEKHRTQVSTIHSVLRSLLLGSGLGLGRERVTESSRDGNGRSNNGILGHGLHEDNGGNNDDDDTLGGVEDRRGDGTDLGSEGEGELVVDVEEESGEGNVGNESLGSVLLASVVPLLLESRSLGNDNHGDGEEEGDEVHHGVDISRIHVLALITLEGLGDRSSELALESSCKIRERGISEGTDIDVDTLALLDAGKADTANDGDEHGISEHGLDIHGRHDETNDGSKDGLAGLDDLSKANGTHTHGKDRPSVSNAGHKADGDAGRDIGGGKVGLLAKAGGPHGDRPNHTDNKLSGSNEPMGMDHVGSLLVVHVVHGVAGIPGNDKKHLSLLIGTMHDQYRNVGGKESVERSTSRIHFHKLISGRLMIVREGSILPTTPVSAGNFGQ